MGNRFKINFTIIILLVISCFSCAWLEKEKRYEIAINNKYKVTYWYKKGAEIAYMNLETANNQYVGMGFAATEILYNDNYVYIKSYEYAYQSYDTLTATYEYYQCKINLESNEIADFELSEITAEKFNGLKIDCKDCKLLNLNILKERSN
jgi:hypothetical protein